MIRNHWFSLAIAAGLASSGPASAAFHAAPLGRHALDLDTPAGNFSSWDAKDLAGMSAVNARFRVSQVRSDARWAPGFCFKLKRGDETIDIQIVGFEGKAPLLLTMRHFIGDKETDEKFLVPTLVNEVEDLEIRWTPQGAVTFRLRNPETLAVSQTGETHTGALAGAPESLQITASTGELEVMALEIGTDDAA